MNTTAIFAALDRVPFDMQKLIVQGIAAHSPDVARELLFSPEFMAWAQKYAPELRAEHLSPIRDDVRAVRQVLVSLRDAPKLASMDPGVLRSHLTDAIMICSGVLERIQTDQARR